MRSIAKLSWNMQLLMTLFLQHSPIKESWAHINGSKDFAEQSGTTRDARTKRNWTASSFSVKEEAKRRRFQIANYQESKTMSRTNGGTASHLWLYDLGIELLGQDCCNRRLRGDTPDVVKQQGIEFLHAKFVLHSLLGSWQVSRGLGQIKSGDMNIKPSGTNAVMPCPELHVSFLVSVLFIQPAVWRCVKFDFSPQCGCSICTGSCVRRNCVIVGHTAAPSA